MKPTHYLHIAMAALALTTCESCNVVGPATVDMSDLAATYENNLDTDNYVELRSDDEVKADTVADVFDDMPHMCGVGLKTGHDSAVKTTT